MAKVKKKAVKKAKKTTVVTDKMIEAELEAGTLVKRVTVEDRVTALEKRIDRIVKAHESCQKLTGL